jgi:serine/threonine-protein kinase
MQEMTPETGSYELLEVLGRGGFATVYRARHTGEGGFRQEVAVKLLDPRPGHEAEVESRHRDEARMLGLVRHPSVVKVLTLTRLAGRWAVVMEYVPGRTLAELIHGEPIPCGVALEIVATISGALHAVYTQPGPDGAPLHLLHRDLKPQNLQITPHGHVKILDFGIAKADFAERESYTRDLFVGTIGYISPERFDGYEGPEADLYALGAVLYECLLGIAPPRASATRSLHELRVAESVDLLYRSGVASHQTVEILLDLLAWDPGRRPSAPALERRCRAAMRRMDGPDLREWCSERLGAPPPLLHRPASACPVLPSATPALGTPSLADDASRARGVAPENVRAADLPRLPGERTSTVLVAVAASFVTFLLIVSTGMAAISITLTLMMSR